MTMLRRLAGRLRGNSAELPDIMAGPVEVRPGNGRTGVQIKVDRVHRIGPAIVVAGWTGGDLDPGLRVDGHMVAATCYRTSREDVATYLGVADGRGLGFVLLAESSGKSVELDVGTDGGATGARFPLRIAPGRPGRDARVQLAPAIERLQAQGINLDPSAHDDGDFDPGTGFAAGRIDDARSSPESPLAVASGWIACPRGTEAWIETSAGRRFPIAGAHRVDRADVRAALSAALSGYGDRAGFLVLLPEVGPGERLRLMVERSGQRQELGATSCASWGTDPVAAARWLFAFPTPIGELAGRIPEIDQPLLEGLIQARQRAWADLPVRSENVGDLPDAPRASVIVPLYGRFDFVEHQLAEFARDPWLRANAEIIYVVDDRDLAERMAAQAWTLQRLYRVPFRWVWGGVNRGFAGANNLGAEHARGRQLVFLNSDAIPIRPGWLEQMLDALDEDPRIGAVGTRLLFGDGSLQHAGMAFRRRHDLGIWTNHHPRMGLDPTLDPQSGPTEVHCVTGACMAMSRDAFERVGGWDTGYLIGDFEDSDLCLTLRDAGLRVLYLPQVELTHLERQSFKLLGEGDFRTRVVVWNAVRHQRRWGSTIEALAALEEAQA